MRARAPFVAGNHDFDKISPANFFAHTENAGEAKGRTWYAFSDGGIRYVVLDGCFNSMAGDHYADGKLRWDVSMVPDEELRWLKAELAHGDEGRRPSSLRRSGRLRASAKLLEKDG
ncbi:hypothetical protein [Sutterella sp.]|uniref:hypothetical protein n=1 Tax=Sutterella sp. TaxID=1981025 RepID=UPI003FD88A10